MGNWKWFSGKSHVQTGEERRVQRVWREVVRVVFCFNFVLKLFPWKDLAAIAALIFLLVSFFPFSWPMFEWWDVTPLALFLSHFTVLGSSYVSLFPSLIFVMMFKKKTKPKFFDGTTWAEKCLEDHVIQSTQCLDLSHSLSSLLTWPLNIYFWNGFINCYDWLKDSWKIWLLLNTCRVVVGFNNTRQQKKQTTCLILSEVSDLCKTICCFIL